MIRTFDKIASGVAKAANAAGTIIILFMVLMVNYEIVARGVFNQPFRGTYEMVQFSLVMIVFLQLPDVIRAGRLTRSDGLLSLITRRNRPMGRTLSRLIDAFSLTFMIIVAYAIWPEFLDMWETQDYFGVPGIFTAPWWPIKLAIFLSACLCAVHFILRIILRPYEPAGLEPHAEDAA